VLAVAGWAWAVGIGAARRVPYVLGAQCSSTGALELGVYTIFKTLNYVWGSATQLGSGRAPVSIALLVFFVVRRPR